MKSLSRHILAITAAVAWIAHAGSVSADNLAPTVQAVKSPEYKVSTDAYNILEFQAPLKRGLLPQGTPLDEAPQYLNGNRTLILEFADEAEGQTYQLIAVLESGATIVVTLAPQADMPGTHYEIGIPATPGAAKLTRGGENPNAAYAPIFGEMLQRDRLAPPSGFKEVVKAKPRFFYAHEGGVQRRVALHPLKSYRGPGSDGAELRMDVYSVRAEKGASLTVDASQFYEPGVAAAYLDSPTVTDQARPVLYVLSTDSAAEMTHE